MSFKNVKPCGLRSSLVNCKLPSLVQYPNSYLQKANTKLIRSHIFVNLDYGDERNGISQ